LSLNFDEAISEIQEAIIKDARKIYSDEVIKRWQNPQYLGEIYNPQGYAKITGPCGDTMEIFLRIQDDKILSAQFITTGCATTVASGSMACELSMGKHIEEIKGISQDEILRQLGGLPEESTHCALLASNTLKGALENYLLSKM